MIPRVGMSIGPALLAAATIGLVRRQLATGMGFDVIDAHYFYPDGVAALWIGRHLRRPVVITARGTDINLLPRYDLPRRMICWGIANADRLIAVSEALKGALVDLGAVPDGVEVLRNGIDLSMFGPADRRVARQKLALSPAIFCRGRDGVRRLQVAPDLARGNTSGLVLVCAGAVR